MSCSDWLESSNFIHYYDKWILRMYVHYCLCIILETLHQTLQYSMSGHITNATTHTILSKVSQDNDRRSVWANWRMERKDVQTERWMDIQGVHLILCFFPGNSLKFATSSSPALGCFWLCKKNYQTIGVAVYSLCVESFEGLLQRCRLGRGCSELWKNTIFPKHPVVAKG